MTFTPPAPARERAARFDMLVRELRVILMFADPGLADVEVLQEARLHAVRRLEGADLLPAFIA